MTGGGSIGSTTARHGFEVHCSPARTPNRLEVNWGKGNRFHLEQMRGAICFDDPAINPEHPAADFDVHKGRGVGRYNGIAGATIEWTFTDDGEPGANDRATVKITDANGATVLDTTGSLRNGNHQAHGD